MNLKIRITQQLQGATGPMTITELSERLDAPYSQIIEAVESLIDQKVVEARQIGNRGKLVSLKTENPTIFVDCVHTTSRPAGNKLKITIEIIADEGGCWYQIKHHPQIWESDQVEGSGNRDHVRGTIRALVRVLVDRFLDGRT